MSRRAIVALSAALSAFILVLAGAAASYTLRAGPASTSTAPLAAAPSPAPAAPAANGAAPTAAGEVIPIAIVRAREAEYRRLLDEANARLRAERTAAAAAAPPAPFEPVSSAAPARAAEQASRDEGEGEHHRGRHEGRRGHREDDDG